MQSSSVVIKSEINNNLKNNLKYLIKKYNIDNETLAKCTGLSPATIASLRSRANNPTILTLAPIAEFFNLTIDQLINSNCTDLELTEHNNGQKQKNIILPIIDIEQVNHWPFPVDKLLSDDTDSVTTTADINTYSYALRLDSEVLMPYYQKNTVFIIDPSKDIQDSNIVVVSLNKQKPTYRQVFIDADCYYFKPINPDFGTMQFYEDYKIHGVVVRAILDIN